MACLMYLASTTELYDNLAIVRKLKVSFFPRILARLIIVLFVSLAFLIPKLDSRNLFNVGQLVFNWRTSRRDREIGF